MFDYGQRVQLALTELTRRSAMMGIAGLVIAVGAGFLLAALWTFLAHHLGWGSALASLAIGGVFVAVGLIVLALSQRKRHPMPTGDDLKAEIKAQINFAADAAMDRAQAEALRVVDMAGNKAQAFMDDAGYRASKFASDAECRVRSAAQSVGLNAQNISAAKKGAQEAADGARRAADSNAGSMAKLISAFAIGVTLAAKLRESRRRHDDDDLV